MRSPRRTHDRAIDLRAAMTAPEVWLWVRLRVRRPGQPRFRRQHPIGPYIADFYCAAARLVIEIDGMGHGDAAQIIHDEKRDAYMAARGYRVLRCAAADVLSDVDAAGEWLIAEAMAGAESDRRKGRC